MPLAVCINCGNLKRLPVEQCDACNFTPDTTETIVKSIILATQDIGDLPTGKSRSELLAISPLVAAHQYRFDEAEVKSLASQMEISLARPFSHILFDMLKTALPALIAIGMAVVLWLTR